MKSVSEQAGEKRLGLRKCKNKALQPHKNMGLQSVFLYCISSDRWHFWGSRSQEMAAKRDKPRKLKFSIILTKPNKNNKKITFKSCEIF